MAKHIEKGETFEPVIEWGVKPALAHNRVALCASTFGRSDWTVATIGEDGLLLLNLNESLCEVLPTDDEGRLKLVEPPPAPKPERIEPTLETVQAGDVWAGNDGKTRTVMKNDGYHIHYCYMVRDGFFFNNCASSDPSAFGTLVYRAGKLVV